MDKFTQVECEEDAAPMSDVPTEPFSRRWHEERIEAHSADLAKELVAWFDRDREAPLVATAIAARITNLARALSAETSAIGELDYREYMKGL